LYNNGKGNGVTSLELISKKQISDMEPNVQAQAALYSADTGIISASLFNRTIFWQRP